MDTDRNWRDNKVIRVVSSVGDKDSKVRKIIIENLLIILIIISVLIGVGLGLGLRGTWTPDDHRKVYYLEFPGRILLNMLKMLILPLVVSSLVTGMASIGSQASGKIGGAAVAYYMCTTLVAVILGIVMVIAIHPGSVDDKKSLTQTGKTPETEPLDAMLDLVYQCFPDNIVTACFQRKVTEISVETEERPIEEGSNLTETVKIEKAKLKVSGGTNVLGIAVFSIALGIVINYLGEEGLPLKAFFSSLNGAVMVLIRVVIWYTPIGLIFLVAGRFVLTKDIAEVWEGLAKYMATVLAGLIIHAIIFLPLIYFICTRNNPFRFGKNMLKAIFTAWGTASSSATLPVTMDCLVEKNKININVVRFVAPVGATINMDGTALYEAVASIYIAQLNGMDLGIAKIIIISLTATAAAIGAAGVPQAGLVTMVIVLTAVGLPTEDVTFILAVDWFLDRFRTAVNVWGDSIGAGILDHFFKNMLNDSENAIPMAYVNKAVDENGYPDEGASSISSSKREKPSSFDHGSSNDQGQDPDQSEIGSRL